MIKNLVKCSEFVKRQTPDSGHSHFDGSWEKLESLVEYALLFNGCVRPGYRDGVILVDVPPEGFYSALVNINESTNLKASYAPRQLGEASFIRISAEAEKQPAQFVSIVLYRHDVLAESGERSTDAKWEIIAIKARVDAQEEPMDPYTMARNFLQLKGGTKGEFTAQQFAESIVYWNNHCMTCGKKSWWKKIVRAFYRR